MSKLEDLEKAIARAIPNSLILRNPGPQGMTCVLHNGHRVLLPEFEITNGYIISEEGPAPCGPDADDGVEATVRALVRYHSDLLDSCLGANRIVGNTIITIRYEGPVLKYAMFIPGLAKHTNP